jgi:hypothetical protein
MFARLILSCLTSVGLFAAAFAQAPAPSQEKHKHHAKMVLRVYQIADLIVPLENAGTKKILGLAPAAEPVKPAPDATRANAPYDINAIAARLDGEPVSPKPCTKQSPEQKMAEQLIQMIARAIAPMSWQENGGKGTMDYHPLTMSLVVSQTAAVQEKIEKFLAELRRLQDVEVGVEVRFITTSEDCCARIGIDFNNTKPGQPQQTAFLTDDQVRKLMEAVQGEQRTNVLQAPKLTIANGQRVMFGVCDTQFFVTHVDVVKNNGQTMVVPRNEALSTGVSMSVQPVVSHDRRFVNLALKLNMTGQTTDKVALVPVVMPIVPKGANGQDQKPVLFTQYLQQPAFDTLTLEKTLNIPDGGTVLMGGWKRSKEVRQGFAPPVLSKIPYVNRLFTNVGYGKETETVLLMVTPRIIVPEPEQAPPPLPCPTPANRREANDPRLGDAPAPCPAPEPIPMPPDLKTALMKYHQACEAGQLDLARMWADAALSMDPTCFDKKR